MVAAIRHEQNLGEALAERAHRASMRRLILDVAGGLLGFGIIAAWRPDGWAILASAALCFATFGAWGAADRLLSSYRITNDAIAASLLILRTLAIVVGVVAALVILFGSLEIAMGTFIH